MALTVVGIFDNTTEAQQAVDALVLDGFGRSNIDISAGSATDTGHSDSTVSDHSTAEDTDKNNGIGGFFNSLFGDDDDDNQKKYSTVANRGSVVTVHTTTDEESERAADILDDNGAVNVDERAAQYGFTGYTAPTDTAPEVAATPSALPTDSDQTIKVIEENLQVGKRTVETGGVRVRSRIIAKPVEESIRLRQERVTLQRTPVNRPATADDLTAFQEGQIELTEQAEVPVVSKTVNVVEEISVGKDVTEREEVIRDTVRHTEVDVDQLGTTDQTIGNRSTAVDPDTDVTYSTK